MTIASVLPIIIAKTVLKHELHIPESLMTEWRNTLDRSEWSKISHGNFCFEFPDQRTPGIRQFWMEINKEDEVRFLNFLDNFAKTHGTDFQRPDALKT